MRTNKFIPFYLALSLHGIPVIYFLTKKPTPPAPIIAAPQGIDLSGFSISQKSGNKKTQSPSNSIKTVGLPAHRSEGSGIGIENSADSGTGPGNSGNNTGPVFTNFHEPSYPPIARQKGYEGKVKIKAYYNQEGLITKVDIIQSSGIKMLDETVKKTASEWKLSSTTAGSFEKVFEFKLNN